jgi:glycosyltransferase involved in cell wall biosynthesis
LTCAAFDRLPMNTPPPHALPPLSIVIRTLNSSPTLGSVLDALDLRPDDQLILVDSGSTDDTVTIARRLGAEVILLAPGEFTYGRALNRGFARARHAWVLVLSSHTVPTRPGFLDHHRKAILRFPDPVTAAVGPIILTEMDRSLPGGLTFYNRDDFAHGWGFGAGNPNALYRHQAWLGRPFDEHLGGGEDLQWYVEALAAGEWLAAVHAAEVQYIPVRGFRDFFRKGRVDFRAARRLIQPHAPSLSGLLVRFAKLSLQALTGQVGFRAFRASLAHGLGNYWESRQPGPAPAASPAAGSDTARANPEQKASSEKHSS